MMRIKDCVPCIYKKSCGWEICMKDACPEYVPKKRGQKFYGEDEQEDKIRMYLKSFESGESP